MLAVCAELLVASVLLPTRASAYRTLADQDSLGLDVRVRWDGPIRFRLASEPVDGLTTADVETAAVSAFNAWSSAGCALPAVTNLGRGPDGVMTGDGVISIAFVRRGWVAQGLSATAAASTEVLYEISADGRTARIVDADILINADNFEWAGDASDPVVRALRPVLVHEIGHALGLVHNCEVEASDVAPACAALDTPETATMFPLYSAEVQRAVQPDDAAGLCFLYGAQGASCAAACGEGDVCQDGDCVPTACAPRGCSACTTDVECPGYCDRGFCRTAGETEAICERDSQCLSGRCGDDLRCASMCGAAGCEPSSYCGSEGACAPVPTDFGDTCDAPSDCGSGLCVRQDLGPTFCTVGCNPRSECPTDYRCLTVEDRAVCVPPRATSCAATHGRRPIPAAVLTLLSMALATALSRKLRCRHD